MNFMHKKKSVCDARGTKPAGRTEGTCSAGNEAIKHIVVHAKIRWIELIICKVSKYDLQYKKYYMLILRVYFDTSLLLGERKKTSRRKKGKRNPKRKTKSSSITKFSRKNCSAKLAMSFLKTYHFGSRCWNKS